MLGGRDEGLTRESACVVCSQDTDSGFVPLAHLVYPTRSTRAPPANCCRIITGPATNGAVECDDVTAT